MTTTEHDTWEPILSMVEGRVLGALLEKERTVPDQYPLTLNALVTACNQATAREPVMRLAEHEVERALASLKAAGLLRFVHPSHGRSVTRFRQVADEKWGLLAPGASLLSLLLLRGPQTVAELRARAERMHVFESLAQVEEVLEHLAEDGLVEVMARAPGRKEVRWRQRVADEVADAVATAAPTDEPARMTAHTRAADPARVPTVEQAVPEPVDGSAVARIGELERQVIELTERLRRLENELGLGSHGDGA